VTVDSPSLIEAVAHPWSSRMYESEASLRINRGIVQPHRTACAVREAQPSCPPLTPLQTPGPAASPFSSCCAAASLRRQRKGGNAAGRAQGGRRFQGGRGSGGQCDCASGPPSPGGTSRGLDLYGRSLIAAF
jgi:hypothetical protein